MLPSAYLKKFALKQILNRRKSAFDYFLNFTDNLKILQKAQRRNMAAYSKQNL